MENTAGASEGAIRRLANIQAITDEAFAAMDVDDLLDTLLDRVRAALGVDTAVVLLLDREERFLVATAAKGLEEEVVQAAHVPVGEGFAGRVAAERRPVYVPHVSSAGVFNPLLAERGLQSLLGVPLVGGGTLVGVMHVGTLAHRRFTGEGPSSSSSRPPTPRWRCGPCWAGPNAPARWSCSAASSRPRRRGSPVSNWPPATVPARRSSAETGTTCSTCRRERSASSWGTWRATGSRQPS
ncbi:putative methionine-R-sulfoxide reductase with GAF domain [Actinomadura luteofluorescens]|uniref:Putative methionine-R-sulfoxide reductase with GAF domain n=1 Tax=Actinomadura luteofluorescens TaxID=46163 RepID=A0A7Y9EFK8_9ACTN|nr:GAF domain-containing protein [Actinomadura luteofluorescens]NYD46858.1 putative methionine-R-sulfoxide reductase with GAF domain [Actinomadura luteofluorescens]